jgi:hypothetical protein
MDKNRLGTSRSTGIDDVQNANYFLNHYSGADGCILTALAVGRAVYTGEPARR